MLLPNLVNKTSFHEFTLTSNLIANSKHILACCPGEGSEPGIWPEPRELPKRSLKAWDSSQRAKILVAPQNMHAVERYGLKFANKKEAGRPVSSCSAQSDWRALHAARRGARWQISNEGLSLRPKGAAALLHRKGESLLQLKMRRGLTCRMEGSHCD